MENDVYKLLDKLNIKYKKIEHPPLFTYEDNEKYNIKFDAVVCKNLFIRNRDKSQYYVFVLPLDKRGNLKLLQTKLGETRFSFGDKSILEEKLGVKAGNVSIFNIVNIKDNDIIFILDEDILKYKQVGFHPNINTETVIFNPEEITKVFEHYNVKYKFITI